MTVLTQARLRELLSYDPETGIFVWRVKPARRIAAGSVAGCRRTVYGYVLIGVDGAIYPAHRLAWLYVHGVWPSEYTDHVNADRADNRLANLRECTPGENQSNRRRNKNNASGFKGVVFHPATGKWRACVRAGGKCFSLGLHATKEQAHAAYCDGASRHHGEFARFA